MFQGKKIYIEMQLPSLQASDRGRARPLVHLKAPQTEGCNQHLEILKDFIFEFTFVK